MIHNWYLCRLGAAMLSLLTSFGFGLVSPVWAQPQLNVVDPGILERSPLFPNILETVAPAVVRVETDRPLQLEVLSAYLGNGPDRDPSGTERLVIVHHGSRRISTLSGNRTLDIPAGTTELEVIMQIERPEQFSRGNYTYLLNFAVVD
jgi:hypothetical protein